MPERVSASAAATCAGGESDAVGRCLADIDHKRRAGVAREHACRARLHCRPIFYALPRTCRLMSGLSSAYAVR